MRRLVYALLVYAFLAIGYVMRARLPTTTYSMDKRTRVVSYGWYGPNNQMLSIIQAVGMARYCGWNLGPAHIRPHYTGSGSRIPVEHVLDSRSDRRPVKRICHVQTPHNLKRGTLLTTGFGCLITSLSI